MPLIDTSTLREGQVHELNEALYNGLDCCITHEVFNEVSSIAPNQNVIYDFERALQAPVLDMMLRGFLIDQYERQKGIAYLEERLLSLQIMLNRFANAIWDQPLNANSPKQLIDFFFGAMRIPEIWSSKKGERKLSVDREALEKLDNYYYARPLVSTILAIRDVTKQLSVLRTEVDPDGRMRTSYSIAGTETGRFSSSKNAYGTGTNLQNITAALRKMFIADPGFKLCGIDLEQAESREVGWLSGTICGDWSYLDACYSGDLHTLVCRIAWPGLPWTDDPKANRAIADSPFYRHLSYRDMAKKLGHGSNYRGLPPTMAKHAKIPVSVAEQFQSNYFGEFKGIPLWHKHVAKEIQTKQRIVTVFGRSRDFFGRPNDDTTLREAIAFGPQGATGDRLNLVLYRIWLNMPEVQLIAQVHDALYFLYPEHLDETEVITKALSYFHIPISHSSGHELIVPGEAKVGWNWGNFDEKSNPDGLKKWKKGQKDNRERTPIALRKL
jgi:DNA polymerase-1